MFVSFYAEQAEVFPAYISDLVWQTLLPVSCMMMTDSSLLHLDMIVTLAEL